MRTPSTPAGGALRLFTTLVLLAAVLRTDAAAAPPSATPAHLVPQVLLLAPEPVRVAWPAAGERISAPVSRKAVVPGQGIAIALVAEGEGRDALLQGCRLTYRIAGAGGETKVGPLRPEAVRKVRSEGAHQLVHLLGAAGVPEAERRRIDDAVTPVSVAAVVPRWIAPEVTGRTEVTVEGEATLPDGRRVALAPARLVVEPWAVAAATPPFQDGASLQAWMGGYAAAPEPQHLGAALRLAARMAKDPFTVVGVPSHAIEAAPPGVVASIVAALKGEEEPSRALGAIALRWAHRDGSALAGSLSPEWRTRIEAFPARPVGYALDPAPASLNATTQRMDLLWAELMATGRPEPVRAIVDLLRFRDDYGVLVKARETPDQDKPLTPELARAVLYVTAGWSLSSFTRTSPIVADYVARWQEDEAVPPVLREELRRLLVNEAFRRPDGGR
ncbi:MAG: hypothetical protein QM704_20360 [Anaeromyxobacteraceae bacterium]